MNKIVNKKTIIVLVSIIFLLILVFLFSKKQKTPLPSPLPSLTPFSQLEKTLLEFNLPQYTQPSPGQDEEVKAAITTKQKLQPYLPIYLENFSTSVGITTTINLYTIPQDPNYLIHFDIYGIDYQGPTTDESTNPNITAFKESFNHAKNLLKQKGVDLKDLYFIFGGPEYIQQTAELWIKTFSLL